MKYIFYSEPETALADQILNRVRLEKITQARRKLWLFGAGTLASFALFVPALEYALQKLAESDIYPYLTLLQNDTTVLFTYSKELSYVLVESLPLFSISILLVTAFMLLSTLATTLKNLAVLRNFNQSIL